MANEFLARKGFISLGGITFPYTEVTGTYTVTDNDYCVDATSGSFTISLPSAVGIEGKIYQIKNSGSGVITVDGNGAQTIDGQTTQTLNQKDSIQIISDGSNWIIAGADGTSGTSGTSGSSGSVS